jgi:co-chaperonin GroES (HSP10)
MELEPHNRYILVEPGVEEEKENSILLPEDYTPTKSRHEVVRVVRTSNDCKIEVCENDMIIVDSSMIEKIKLGEEDLYFILENYVLARVGS